MVRSILLGVGDGAALKGESGGVTGIVVEKLRFVHFLTSIESEQKLPQWSPTFERSLIPYLSLFIFKLDDLGSARDFFDVFVW